jgi:RNA polymerase sigma factor (sigma-70 family)
MLAMTTRIREGTKDAAFSDLLVAGFPAARRVALYIMRDSVAAEDAVQEAALQAWEKRGSLRDPSAIDAWFGRILVNTCMRELRQRSRKSPVKEVSSTSPDFVSGISEQDEVGRAIRSLSPDDQVLLALRFGRDMTVPQIASFLDVREGTVKSRLHSTQERVRAALDAQARLVGKR